MKSQMIMEITGRLFELGIVSRNGKQSDITVETGFLSAGEDYGKGLLHYVASVYADDQNKTLFMYEKVDQTSVLQGNGLEHQLKSIRFGLDGTMYEHLLELDSVSRTVKSVAKQFGYRYRRVSEMEKAQYPARYAPVSYSGH